MTRMYQHPFNSGTQLLNKRTLRNERPVEAQLFQFAVNKTIKSTIMDILFF